MRLIDLDEFLRENCISRIEGESCEECKFKTLEVSCEELLAQPTIDPVKHGRWEMGGGYLFPNWTCSRCKCIFCGTEEFPKKYKFCPQCGTRMYEE